MKNLNMQKPVLAANLLSMEVNVSNLKSEINLLIRDYIKFENPLAHEAFVSATVEEVLKLDNVRNLKGVYSQDISICYHRAVARLLDKLIVEEAVA